MSFKRLVIIGGTGFVGRNLAKHLRPHFPEVVCTGRNGPLRYDDRGEGYNDIDSDDLVINASGWKDVPACELKPTEAYESNALKAGNLAAMCKHVGCKFVHISSDHAYAEPRTVYGDSKRLGEELVRRENPYAIIAVTGHVYDVDCPWVKWLDGELRAGRKVEAWRDIWNRPIYAGDLAAVILRYATTVPTRHTVEVYGRQRVDRWQLFRDYAEVFGYNRELIVESLAPAPPHYPRSFGHASDFYYSGCSPIEGFRRMKEEMERAK